MLEKLYLRIKEEVICSVFILQGTQICTIHSSSIKDHTIKLFIRFFMEMRSWRIMVRWLFLLSQVTTRNLVTIWNCHQLRTSNTKNWIKKDKALPALTATREWSNLPVIKTVINHLVSRAMNQRRLSKTQGNRKIVTLDQWLVMLIVLLINWLPKNRALLVQKIPNKRKPISKRRS